jgi:hypothetical protein
MRIRILTFDSTHTTLRFDVNSFKTQSLLEIIMSSELPTKDQLHQQVVEGRPITQSEASAIAAAEFERSDAGPIKGGSAATAQSLHDKQQNFLEKAGEVARKYPGEVTKEDAATVQRAEVCPSLTVPFAFKRGRRQKYNRELTCPFSWAAGPTLGGASRSRVHISKGAISRRSECSFDSTVRGIRIIDRMSKRVGKGCIWP